MKEYAIANDDTGHSASVPHRIATEHIKVGA